MTIASKESLMKKISFICVFCIVIVMLFVSVAVAEEQSLPKILMLTQPSRQTMTWTLPPLEQLPITEREVITLEITLHDSTTSRSNGDLKPGDIVIIEARISPEFDYVRDILFVDFAFNGEPDTIILEKYEQGVYLGKLEILNEHIGEMRFLSIIPRIENDNLIAYMSNIVELFVSPDPSMITGIKFISNSLIVTEGTESRIEILAYDNNGNIVYDLSNFRGITLFVQDSSIASVADGILTAKTQGRTTITASYLGFQVTSDLIIAHAPTLYPTGPIIQEKTLMPIPISPQ